MMTSRKNTGRPLPKRKIKYGMRNAPANEQRREGEAVSVTAWPVRHSLPSPPNQRYQRSEGCLAQRPNSDSAEDSPGLLPTPPTNL